MAHIEEYKGKRIVIRNNARRCIHSRHCVLNTPEVFVPNVDGPWIHPDAAAAEAAIATVVKCPSGALTYEPADDSVTAEKPPGVNTVRVWEDGPLAFLAELDVNGDKSTFRATLCRCGKSNHKPFCDKMHVKAGFKATGEPASKEVATLATRNGPLKVTPTKNGPLHVTGALEVCTASGRTVLRDVEMWLCRCGHSNDKPFCDGSHEKVGFIAPGVEE
ncbi:MAG: CDGSH iron-sulfur domain-containing protein [Proteobacteria bacterium]|nr:CDGSH iron-sulfur domain-containing protein [Pseudomonadota bacterium]